MLRYYLNSFIVDYQQPVSRKEFLFVLTTDLLVIIKMVMGLYVLTYGPQVSYITFLNPLLTFFWNYRIVTYILVGTWLLLRHAALVGLMARRLTTLGYNPNWMYVPFYRIYLCLKKRNNK
ncbi:MAG: hypothetical protein AAF770_01245 [Bacteroidota bacterium]